MAAWNHSLRAKALAQQDNDWNPGAYAVFRDFRLRPAYDLLAQVPSLPEGEIIDLGCGDGAVAAALHARFGQPLTGVDNSDSMLEKAVETGRYKALIKADIADWTARQPALIFSNAALHWLPDHCALFPRLAKMLCTGGVLAVQMPRQFEAPSHVLLRETAAALFPDRFDFGTYRPAVAPLQQLAGGLCQYGALNMWETSYYLRLKTRTEGHPVRHFTYSTAARPFLAKMDAHEQSDFLAAYDDALFIAYPPGADGGCNFPFLRQFVVLVRGASA